MASVIQVLTLLPDDRADEALGLVDQVFQAYEVACSRFDPHSELNTYLESSEPQVLSPELSTVLQLAFAAYVETDGRFDPRVRATLEALGYGQTFSGLVELGTAPTANPQVTLWENPVLDAAQRRFRPQGSALDLGGIAKGAALAAAASRLHKAAMHGLVSAGGDLVIVGPSDGRNWPIAIEDPIPGATDPVAVVEVSSGAVMTSSVRVRQWRAGTTPVHHLIDPRTGLPGGHGLAAVTVIGDDPVAAEVWSKTLFLDGLVDGLAEAEQRGLSAIFVSREGDVVVSSTAQSVLTWVRPT
jgi:thiamine biosynthesis lipoprotein